MVRSNNLKFNSFVVAEKIKDTGSNLLSDKHCEQLIDVAVCSKYVDWKRANLVFTNDKVGIIDTELRGFCQFELYPYDILRALANLSRSAFMNTDRVHKILNTKISHFENIAVSPEYLKVLMKFKESNGDESNKDVQWLFTYSTLWAKYGLVMSERNRLTDSISDTSYYSWNFEHNTDS